MNENFQFDRKAHHLPNENELQKHDAGSDGNQSSSEVFVEATIRESIAKGEGWPILFNLEEFHPLDRARIIDLMKEAGCYPDLAVFLDKIDPLDDDLVNGIIESGNGWAIASSFHRIEGSQQSAVLDSLITRGDARFLFQHLDKIPGDRQIDLCRKTVAAGQGFVVAEFAGSLEAPLRLSAALLLIDAKLALTVANFIAAFEGVDLKVVVSHMIEAGALEYVAAFRRRFVEAGADEAWMSQVLAAHGFRY